MSRFQCVQCGSELHADCDEAYVLAHDGWYYSIETFVSVGTDIPNMWEIKREQTAMAYGDFALAQRDMRRIRDGEIPLKCCVCHGAGALELGESCAPCAGNGHIWARGERDH